MAQKLRALVWVIIIITARANKRVSSVRDGLGMRVRVRGEGED